MSYWWNPGWWSGHNENAVYDHTNHRIILQNTTNNGSTGSATLFGYDLTGGYQLSVSANFISNETFSIIFNKTSAGNEYYITYSTANNILRLCKQVNGNESLLGQISISNYSGTIELTIIGGIITCTYEGTTIYTGSFTDTIVDGITFMGGSGSNISTPISISNVTLDTYSGSPTSSFTVVKDNLTATFTDTSTNTPTIWAWDFGDGTTSILQNPIHIYEEEGTYTVSLISTNSAGSSIAYTQSVTVTAPIVITPVSSFTELTTSLMTVFTDTSINSPTSWLWDFGDGITSTLQNPSHAYTIAGTYTVSLISTNSAGSSIAYTQSVTVTNPPHSTGKFNIMDANGNPISYLLFSSMYTNTVSIDQMIQIGSNLYDMSNITVQAVDLDPSLIPPTMQKRSKGCYKDIQISTDEMEYPNVLNLAPIPHATKQSIYARCNIPSYAARGTFMTGLEVTATCTGTVIQGFENWNKYAVLSVTGSTDGVLTNYPLAITVNYRSEMRSDFGDIRFTFLDGTNLEYDMVDFVSGDHADFLVSIPNLPASPTITNIYVLSGNSTVTDASNPESVYMFYDDFADLSKWNISGNVTLTSDGVNVAYNSSLALMNVVFNPVIDPVNDFIVTARYKQASSYRNRLMLGNSENRSEIHGNDFGWDWGVFESIYWGGVTGISLLNNRWYQMQWINSATNYIWKILTDNGSSTIYSTGGGVGKIVNLDELTFSADETSVSNFNLNWVKVQQTTAHPPTVGILGSSIVNSTHTTVTELLIIQGNVLYDSPMSAPQLPDKEIYITVDGTEYPIGGQYTVEDRGNDATSTFSVPLSSPQDLYLVSGQKIKFMERNKDPKGWYNGELQKMVDHDEPAGRLYTLTGRDLGNTLVTQPFSLSAVESNPTTYTTYEILDLILEDTNIPLGPSVDITVKGGIVNQNDVYNGYANNWNTKSDALNDLLALVSILTGKNVNWFIDSNGLLRIFYTDVADLSVGISIYKTNPRKYSLEYTEDSENIINYQEGTAGSNNTITSIKQDLDSQNGWIDPTTGIKWPGYGIRPGSPIQNSKITNQTDLDSATQNVINLYSKPIFTVIITLSRFPEVEIGQPVYIPDHYKLKGMVFVISDRVYTGDEANRVLTITATTDRSIMGPLSNHEAVKLIAQTEVQKSAPFIGTAIDKGVGSITVQPVNQLAAINARNLGT
jgi:PKD repeat protein